MEILADTGVVPSSVLPDVEKQLAALRLRYPQSGLLLFDETMVRSGRWSGSPESSPAGFAAQLLATLQLDPRLDKAWYQLSTVYMQQKDTERACDALRRAIAIAPNKAQYHYRLAFAYRQAGDMAAFAAELAQYVRLHAATGSER